MMTDDVFAAARIKNIAAFHVYLASMCGLWR